MISSRNGAMPPTHLTRHQVARRLHRSPRTILRWLDDPDSWLPAPFVFGNRLLWRIDEREAAEQTCRRLMKPKEPNEPKELK